MISRYRSAEAFRSPRWPRPFLQHPHVSWPGGNLLNSECRSCSARANDRYCGRRVAVLYAAGELFACRCCCGLAYASQQKSPLVRNVSRSQKIRMRLGGRPDNSFGPIPKRPCGMWRRTYERHCAALARACATGDGNDRYFDALIQIKGRAAAAQLSGAHRRQSVRVAVRPE